MIRMEWQVTCDRTRDDGVSCIAYAASTPEAAEELARLNGWTGGDGYHECPRHREGQSAG